jgi:hypothetical protein
MAGVHGSRTHLGTQWCAPTTVLKTALPSFVPGRACSLTTSFWLADTKSTPVDVRCHPSSLGAIRLVLHRICTAMQPARASVTVDWLPFGSGSCVAASDAARAYLGKRGHCAGSCDVLHLSCSVSVVKELLRRLVAQGLMWPDGVVGVLVAAERLTERFKPWLEIDTGIEFIAVGALQAFDHATSAWVSVAAARRA